MSWRSWSIGAVAALAALSATVALAFRERKDPARCAQGFTNLGPHCRPASGCPAGFVGMESSCVVINTRIAYPGGQLDLGASDWEAEPSRRERRATVKPFEMDSAEVTLVRWFECQNAGQCRELAVTDKGVPVSGVSPAEAARFCDFSGGRLPSGDEWLFAAGGVKGRRYAWGQTGLVCRRAVFGLVDGPCARGAKGPDLAGSRPDGKSPEGAFDLSGNVAEWAKEPDGSFRARGGSFRSMVAGELKTGSEESSGPADHVGFRCAYDPKLGRTN